MWYLIVSIPDLCNLITFIPGGAEKGGYSGAHPYYVIHRELPPENVVRGDQKLCKRSPYNASLKLSKAYVKLLIFQHAILNAK